MSKLGDFIRVKHGWAFKGEYFANEGYQSILTPGNFYEKGGFRPNDGKERYYVGEYPPEYLCKKGDLIVAMTEQAAGLLGSTAIVPEDNKYLHNQRIGLITFDEERIDKYFLYYLFMTKSVRKQIRGSSSGTKVKHTSPEKICDVNVDIPDISTQRRIGALLWMIDSQIIRNNQIIAELEELIDVIYDYKYLQFRNIMEESDKDLPNGWKQCKVAELLDVVTGKEDANFSEEDGKYKFFTCAQETSRCNEAAFNGKAILIAGNGDFSVKHYSGEFNAYQRTYVLIPRNEAYFGLVYMAAKNKIKAFKMGSNGSIVKFITKGDVENIIVNVPKDENELQELNLILTKIESIEKRNEELENIIGLLLPMLMNGQITITDKDIDK